MDFDWLSVSRLFIKSLVRVTMLFTAVGVVKVRTVVKKDKFIVIDPDVDGPLQMKDAHLLFVACNLLKY